MNDFRKILIETATQVLRDLCRPETINAAEQGVWPADLWNALEETGLTRVSLPEEPGGPLGDPGDALAILRVAGRFAAPVPLAETYLAGWLLGACGQPIPAGPLTIAPVRPGEPVTFTPSAGGWLVSGAASRIPWAARATRIVVLGRAGDRVVLAAIDPAVCQIAPGQNLAGEPRDDVAFEGVQLPGSAVIPAAADLDEAALRQRGALTRTVQMAGGLEHLLDLSVTYARERVQFGRPIGRFQAVQQQLAVLATEVAAAGAAADGAVEARRAAGDPTAAIAAAKVRVGEAAGKAAAIAHQVHGATGFTHEHSLHQTTRRLWSWREEFGQESDWAASLGRLIAARGAEALWPFISESLPAAGER